MAVINNSLQLNDRMTPVLRSIIRALDSTLEAMASVDRVAQREFQAAARATGQARQAVEQFRTSVNGTSADSQRSFNTVANGANTAQNAIKGLVDQVKMLAGAYLGIQGVQKLVSGGDTFIGNTARLGLMVKEGEKVEDLQKKIYEAAQRSTTNYNDMTAAVTKLGITAKHSFSSNNEIIAFTEALNKQFAIAGTGAQEQSAAMYQLTQAMASGRLQGDEFRSIMENAPMLAQTIADHMGLTFGQLREASSEGKITAGIIKQALLSTAVEAGEKFNNMPMSFGQLWTQAVNRVNRGLEPLYQKLRQMWNNPDMQTFLTQMTNGFVALVNLGLNAFNVLATIAGILYNNWSFIEPILFAIGAIVLYSVIPTLWAMVPPLLAAAGAWLALNWPILLIGVIIASLVGILNAFGIKTSQIIGFIVGIIMTFVSFLWNIIYGVISAILSLLDFFGNMVMGVVEWIYNAFNGGFNSIGGAAANLIGQMISWFLQLGKVVTTIIDAIFGTKWTDGLTNLQDKVTSWGKNKDAATFQRDIASNKAEELGIKRAGYKDTFKTTSGWAKGKVNDVKDVFKVGDRSYGTMPVLDPSMLGDIAGNTGATAGNTKKLTEGISLADEDIELLKETARISFVNRFTTMTPQITASFGDVHETADTKAIMGVIEKSVIDALQSSLE